jgi:hypothetical protein
MKTKYSNNIKCQTHSSQVQQEKMTNQHEVEQGLMLAKKGLGPEIIAKGTS